MKRGGELRALWGSKGRRSAEAEVKEGVEEMRRKRGEAHAAMLRRKRELISSIGVYKDKYYARI